MMFIKTRYGGTSAMRKDEVGVSIQPYSQANEATAVTTEILVWVQ